MRVRVGSRLAKARREKNSRPGRRSVNWRNNRPEITLPRDAEPLARIQQDTYFHNVSGYDWEISTNSATTITWNMGDYVDTGNATGIGDYTVFVNPIIFGGSAAVTGGYYGWTSESDEAREARLQREREAEEKRKKALDRANRLLMSLLSKEQREEYESKKTISLTSNKGRKFRLLYGYTGNVEQLSEDGTVDKRYCVAPSGGLSLWSAAGMPVPDVLAAQLLGLSTDEESYLRVANLVFDRLTQVQSYAQVTNNNALGVLSLAA